MSGYENYSQDASTYDLLRHPDGADVEIAMVQLYCNKPLNDIRTTYHTAEGPLDKDWRDYIVVFNEATEEELDDVLDKVRKMKDDGTLQGFMECNDKIMETGIFTVIFARALSA